MLNSESRLFDDDVPLLLFMMRTLFQRVDQLALQQEEMQRKLMQKMLQVHNSFLLKAHNILHPRE